MPSRRIIILCCAFLLSDAAARCQSDTTAAAADTVRYGPVIPATETMSTAWDFPRNPLTDSLPPDAHAAELIKLGFKIFTNTPNEADRLSGNRLSCNNCHLNGGQKEKAMPLVGVSGMYPEYNKRAGRLITLEDRIIECFLRSSNATGKLVPNGDSASGGNLIASHENEVLALSSYITWLSSGYAIGRKPPWRGQNIIDPDKLLPRSSLDPRIGKKLYLEKCITCHGENGQGVEIGDKTAGPLWGPRSWNDGAGAARVYTLAGIIRYMMPYLDPGSLTDEEAQHIAAFINSQPRPVYPYKAADYAKEKVPADAVYYKK